MFSLLDICILHFYVWKWCMWNRYHVWSIFLLFYIQYSAFSCITPYMRAWYKLCKIYPPPLVNSPFLFLHEATLYFPRVSVQRDNLMRIANAAAGWYDQSSRELELVISSVNNSIHGRQTWAQSYEDRESWDVITWAKMGKNRQKMEKNWA